MTALALLREVDFLAPLDDDTLTELVAHAQVVRHKRGDRIVSELESGADVFVLLEGAAEVFVEPRRGEKKVFQTLAPGRAFGEMSSLTGGLRSATVEATSDVEVLVIRDAAFDQLRERRPEVAVALLRTLAKRLAEADRAVDALLSETAQVPATKTTLVERGSIKRVWHELVVDRNRDLTFLTLISFVLTLVVVRLVVYCSFRLDFAPRGVLRAAYMTGFSLLFASGGSRGADVQARRAPARRDRVQGRRRADLQRARRHAPRSTSSLQGHLHTADPDVAFNVERLYRRTEPIRAIAIGLVVLIQAAYLRHFYRRVVHREDACAPPVRARQVGACGGARRA